ncbi:MAG: glycosyltransferase [Arcicella sp.]|jgi:glycosyltransferase involved in cell wall biosynthesis|nr:glycosyltransferase [Arcicella sp.]
MTKNILIFEPDASGHHSGYLYHLIINYLQNNYNFKLLVLVAPNFFTEHPQIIEKTISKNVVWLSFSEEEYQRWLQPKSVLQRANFEWKLFCQYAKTYNAHEGLLMYIDYLQLAILTQTPPPCLISGILFRPTLVNYHADSWKEKLNHWRKALILKQVLKQKVVRHIFNLDPFATQFIQEKWGSKKVQFLPDPVQIYPSQQSISDTKTLLGIERNRTVFLIFGFLDSRKGISDVMNALEAIDKEKSKKGTLLLVGPWEESERQKFDNQLDTLKNKTYFQILLVDKFIPDEEIQPYFEITDYVLALYDKHIGMSAITVRAAAAQKPLLTYDFGLMGKMVSEHELGLIVKQDLPDTIEKLLTENVEVGNKQKMKQYADLNRAENYAKVILEALESN